MQNVDGRDMWPLTFPPPTHKGMLTHTQACMHTQWVKTTLILRGYSCSDYRVLNSLFKMYLLLCTQTDAKQKQITASSLFFSICFQTHDACVE